MILTPREFISKAMADAKTMFDVFDAIVGRMESDAAKITELEAQLIGYKKTELANLMSDISEEHYCAGWLIWLEFALWRMVADPTESRRFGMFDVPEDKVQTMKALSEAIGGWETGDGFVPMAEWLDMFAKHEALK